jgi:hypothetical protein
VGDSDHGCALLPVLFALAKALLTSPDPLYGGTFLNIHCTLQQALLCLSATCIAEAEALLASLDPAEREAVLAALAKKKRKAEKAARLEQAQVRRLAGYYQQSSSPHNVRQSSMVHIAFTAVYAFCVLPVRKFELVRCCSTY